MIKNEKIFLALRAIAWCDAISRCMILSNPVALDYRIQKQMIKNEIIHREQCYPMDYGFFLVFVNPTQQGFPNLVLG